MSGENLTGQTLGQYELREMLGVGGMGTVYRAFQMALRREVAIKVLPVSLASQAGYVERFNREAETAAALEHPHIVPVYDYGMQRGTSYIVMRLLSGGALSDRVEQYARAGRDLPSLGEIADLLGQLASALDYAHARGVVHRDIKPSNVMFDNQGNAFLMDFGIAKLLEATHGLTATGLVMGTPSYMAPEQWRAETPGPATDQYALGIMIYVLLTGRVPFEAPTPYGLMHKHLNEQPTPPQALRPDLPPVVTQVLDRAMAKYPEDRYPTVTTLAQSFQRAVAGQAGGATGFFTVPVRPARSPLPPVQPSPLRLAGVDDGTAVAAEQEPAAVRRPVYRRAGVWGLVAVALVALGMIAVLLLFGGKDNEKTASLADTSTATTMPDLVQTQAFLATADAQTLIAQVPSPTATTTPDLVQTQAFLATADAQTLIAQTPTATATTTPDLQATADQMVIQAITETASAWTATPTPSETPTTTATPTETLTSTPSPTQIPTETPTATLTLAPTSTLVPTVEPESVGECPSHVVQAGDTLFLIGVMYELPTLDDLLAVNNLELDSQIAVGDVLIIPVPGCMASSMAVPTAAPIEPTVAVPATAAGGTQIAFVSERDGNREIYVMNTDGSEPQRLTVYDGIDADPSWSPDGTQIVFFSDRDGNNEIYRMNSDGSGLMRLTNHNASDTQPVWSPDGTQIVFASDRDGAAQLYTMHPDGSEPQLLSYLSPGNAAWPAWSPDGRQIVFVSIQATGLAELYVMDANGGNVRLVTIWGSAMLRPAWSPDGARLVFSSDASGNFDIYVVDAAGGDPLRLTDSEAADYWPAWSPDGAQIVFASTREGGSAQILVMNTDGSGQRSLTAGSWNDSPAWMPVPGALPAATSVGMMTAMSCDEYMRVVGAGICLQPFEGGPRVRVLNGIDLLIRPEVSWSPDGQRLAFSGLPPGGDEGGDNRIYVANVDGSGLIELPPSVNSVDPAWSPDGEWLAFHDHGHLAIMHPDGSGLTVLVEASEGMWTTNYPEWSPDSREIAVMFSFDLRVLPQYELWVVALDGSSTRYVTTVSYNEPVRCAQWAAFSPDGTRIAYNDADCRPVVINADGSGEPQPLDTFPFEWTSAVFPQWGGASGLTETGSLPTPTLASASEQPAEGPAAGEALFVTDCSSCHGAEDGAGPALPEMVQQAPFRVEGLAAEDYLAQSILDPGEHVVEGFANVMPPDYGDRYSSAQVADLVAYLSYVRVGRLRRLSGSDSSQPSWSPDGRQIVFSFHNSGTTNADLYVVDAQGGEPRQLTDTPEYESDPAWSPDGSQIAFVTNRDGNYDIYVMSADGSNPQRLTSEPEIDHRYPVWSPDGSRIVFVVERSTGNSISRDIYVMNADGSDQHAITSDSNSTYPDWSPDGVYIIFLSDYARFVRVNADGSDPQPLTDDAEGILGRGRWSPDGAQIAFGYHEPPLSWEYNYNIFVINVDGTGWTRLYGGSTIDTDPAWSPDGRQIAFSACRTGVCVLYVLDVRPPADSASLAPKTICQVQVAQSTANIRRGPATTYEVVGTPQQGTRLAVIGQITTDALWYHVLFEADQDQTAGEGWVRSDIAYPIDLCPEP